jgi:DNA mismatch repair ATPase MutS
MCGVPIKRADDYLQRLIALGHRLKARPRHLSG